MLYAEVIVDNKIPHLIQYFDYLIPQEWKKIIKKGMRVIVPFGSKNTYRLGYILKLKEKSLFEKKAKAIVEILDKVPFLNEELFLLAEEMLKNPFINTSLVYNVIIPRSFLSTYMRQITILQEKELPSQIKEYLVKKKGFLTLKDNFLSKDKLLELQKRKIIDSKIIISKKDYRPKLLNFYYLNPCLAEIPNLKLTTKQQKIIQSLKDSITNNKIYFYSKEDICKFLSSVMLKKLVEQKIILIQKKEVFRKPKEINLNLVNSFVLNKKQDYVYKQICWDNYNNYLLYYDQYEYKIAIYLKLIQTALQKQKQVLILVAEIILIISLKKQIQKYFPNIELTILKNESGLTEHYQKNQDIQYQQIFIVIGTKKAIFAPLQKIGVLIIDEENDESLIEKDKIPNYDAKELAYIRAKYHNIPLIFFTTMPSMDSYLRIKQKQIIFFDLTKKNKKMMQLIDMKQELKQGNLSPLSSVLLEKLMKNIKEKKKTILFINILGFAPFVLCRFCGYVPKCDKCRQNLVFFHQSYIFKCTFCHYSRPFSSKCPCCSNSLLKNVTLGIEYISIFLKKQIPSVNLAIIDSNSVQTLSQYQNILKKLDNNEIDLLLGTEMVAKNLKLPSIETVGILMVDALLNIPHFKATEKTFQLLMKMSNYLSDEGEMIVQGYNIQHYTLQKGQYYDIFSFLEQSLKERELTNNPPFAFYSKILISHKNYLKVSSIALKIKENLENHLCYKIKILGPTYPLIFYKNKNYRALLTLKYNDWPLDLNFIIEQNLNEDALLLFDRFAAVI